MDIKARRPVWQDYEATIGEGEALDYSIRYTDPGGVEREIYRGRAVPRPYTITAKVRIGDVCADWLGNPFPTAEGFSLSPALSRKFTVRNETAGVDADAVQLDYDWSYDDDLDYDSNPVLIDPVSPWLSEFQPIVLSVPKAGTLEVTLVYGDGTTSALSYTATGAGNVRIEVSKLPNASSLAFIEAGGMRWGVRHCPHDAVLFYLNRYGGWDSLVATSALQAETFKASSVRADYDPRDLGAVGTRNYLAEVTERWTLHTGWLTPVRKTEWQYDAEQARQGRYNPAVAMRHVFGTPSAYLMFTGSALLNPVVLTDTNVTYKDTPRNGGRPFDFAVGVQMSQNRIRR